MIQTKINISEIEPGGWNKLLKSATNSTPFVSTKYLRNKNPIYFYVQHGEDLIAGIVLNVQRLFVGLKYIWIDSGILISGDLTLKEKGEISVNILKTIMDFAKKRHALFIYFSHWARELSSSDLKNAGFEVKKTATFEIELNRSEEYLFAQLRPDNRKKISKAIRNDLYVKHFIGEEGINHINEFYSLHKATYIKARKKNPKNMMSLRSPETIRKVIETFQKNVILSMVFYQKEAIAGNLMIGFNGRLYPYIAGTDSNRYRNKGGTNLLFWEIIKFGQQNNYTLYDLGGVPVTPDESHPSFGVYRFKKSFGGVYKEIIIGTWYINRLVKIFSENKHIVRLMKMIT